MTREQQKTSCDSRQHAASLAGISVERRYMYAVAGAATGGVLPRGASPSAQQNLASPLRQQPPA
jgi:hypothetical protein|eukprot:COSAG01_NODE_526_length_15908_cov_6.178063_19_plen_64_part_00